MKVKAAPTIMTSSWIWIGDVERGDEFNGDENGKYLFFSNDQNRLIEIATIEVKHNDFILAKVAMNPRDEEYVLCLYWYDDSRKDEFVGKYPEVKYRYWKNNAATRAGVKAVKT